MRGTFSRDLAERNPDPAGREWIFVAYDQLQDGIGPLSRRAPEDTGVVLVESPAKAARRPYHRRKLGLVLANLRWFALEQAERGVAIRHVVSPRDYAAALRPLAAELGPITAMEPAERELRRDLAPLVAEGAIRLVAHEGWLTTEEDFRAGAGESPPWRMDRFYRHVRRRSGILMRDGKPEGGRFSHDAENRLPWRGEPPAPEPPRFPSDAIKEEVAELIEERFADHPGVLDPADLPATAADAEAAWAFALDRCLTHFGPYEDAMSTRSRTLFHTRISELLNLHRLLPARVVADVAASDAPLPSREGFVRQVLGWREFVRHVHRETDGFRKVPVSHLGADRPLPPAFWGETSGLRCLDTVVGDVWETGYGHHITRLMVLSNLATLLDVSPRELTDWFWAAYSDAYDWVVEPNVLGMGTFAAGDLMTTKPYVSGAAYIHRLSDYCADCSFDPKKDCPVTPLYWAFLERHRDALEDNPRMRLPLRSLEKRPEERKRRDRATFEAVSKALTRGEKP